jgi:sulfoxide reductase heme-binding subunit YedZ
VGPRARRLRANAALLAACAAGWWIIYTFVNADRPSQRVSLAAGYLSFALLAVTLAIGPLSRLKGRRYPVSTYLRRDFAVWAGVLAIVHVVAGLQVHAKGHFAEYFVWMGGSATHVGPIRADAFGIANYVGAIATLAIVALLVTSSDAALRRLGTARWSALHSVAYPTAILVMLHGALYAMIEARALLFVLLFALLCAGTLAPRLVARRRTTVTGAEPGTRIRNG